MLGILISHGLYFLTRGSTIVKGRKNIFFFKFLLFDRIPHCNQGYWSSIRKKTIEWQKNKKIYRRFKNKGYHHS